MKKVALLLLSASLTFGAFAQKKPAAQKIDTIDASRSQVIKVGDKFYSVYYLEKATVVYLNSTDDLVQIFNVLDNSVQSQYTSSVIDGLKQEIYVQIPAKAKQK